MKLLSTRQTLFEFLVTIAFLVGIGLMSWRSVIVSEEADEWVNHSYAVLSQVQIMLRFAYNADTNMRGFLVTGDPGYLEAGRAARAELSKHLPKLTALISGNANQQALVSQVQSNIDSTFSALDQMVDLRSRGQFDVVHSSQLLKESKTRMDRLQTLLTTMESAEDSLLVQRLAEAKRRSETNIFTITVVMILVIVLAILLMSIAANRRRRAEEAVREAAILLEDRTKELERANRAKDRLFARRQCLEHRERLELAQKS